MTELDIFTLPEDMIRLKEAGYDITNAVFAWMDARVPHENLQVFYNNKHNRDRWSDVMLPTFSFQELKALLPKSFYYYEFVGAEGWKDLDYYPMYGPGNEVGFYSQAGEYTLEVFDESTINKSLVEALLWIKEHRDEIELQYDYGRK